MDMYVIAHGAVDVGDKEVITALYHVDKAWVTYETFATLDAYGSQVYFGAGGGFMRSAHVLCGGGGKFLC